jgi:ElaB/YqjD/DUF883 family membrane-anchored ribosome-binding protein
METRSSGQGEQSTERLADSANTEAADEACSQFGERARAGVKAADRVVRDHPYEAIGIAFGIGILLGILLNRK